MLDDVATVGATIPVDTASDDVWQGQQRIGINMRGRVERITLGKREVRGTRNSIDGWQFADDAGTCDETVTWYHDDNVAARWPMIAAGQPRQPAAPSLEVYLAIANERKRILAAWVEEMDLLGEHDTCNNMMGQLQPWFERMVNEVSHDVGDTYEG